MLGCWMGVSKFRRSENIEYAFWSHFIMTLSKQRKSHNSGIYENYKYITKLSITERKSRELL